MKDSFPAGRLGRDAQSLLEVRTETHAREFGGAAGGTLEPEPEPEPELERETEPEPASSMQQCSMQ